ncbi:MAG: leucine--tRNA ligase, partial [Bacteroidales bacterium]|nr:leucine--tRNA ligase [Bacteroidales bacterium]
KRLKGFNVLHPMGYDAYGLPAEQYAIQTGQHPAITTEQNIARYREQLDKIGFSFDWDREVRTCNPEYYKWTQWTFIQLFNHYYCNKANKALPIGELEKHLSLHGTDGLDAACSEPLDITAEQWNAFTEKERQQTLMNYRLAYLADIPVNWCPKLGTVLANDEVVGGLSVRGGYPVERKLMRQWSLRITAYSQRLLDGLDLVDWTDSLKEIQRNWIGRSEGASVFFNIENSDKSFEIFTTRPDTIFGVTFMVLCPEHEMITDIATPEQKKEVEEYLNWALNRSERERQAEVKKVSGVFTGAYAINPLTNERIPIWVSDYVLAGYGTGAIMAVPAHDSRDFAFARHFNLPIRQVVSLEKDVTSDPATWTESMDAKTGYSVNSGFVTGMKVKDAMKAVIDWLDEKGIGTRTVNYRLRDAIFSRQRYWGEPFPIYYKDGMPYPLPADKLPLQLPNIDKFLPTETGEPPLGHATKWAWDTEKQQVVDNSLIDNTTVFPLELSTMPGFAGSSGYYLRYMDPRNNNEYFSQQAVQYWQNVDLYVGGAEHGTGHLIYARFWNKFLFDMGLSVKEEPFQKLINQGMIQGRSNFVYRVSFEKLAEYRIWQLIKDGRLGADFKRDYKDGKRRFDFYSDHKKMIIEIKRKEALEKLSEVYREYATEKGFKILLISINDVMNGTDNIEQRIKACINGDYTPALEPEDDTFVPYPLFVSKNIEGCEEYTVPIHVDINMVNNDILDTEKFKAWRPEFADAQFQLEDGKYVCGWEIEKMSKSMFNVQNPDDLVERYGADTLRLYEMFLGPIEQAKPWDTNGIEGVFRFMRKLWKLYHNEKNDFCVSDEAPTKAELKTLHQTIKKVTDDIERFSFNTSVSTFMICVNDLSSARCNKRQVLEPLTVLIAPFAPHIAEELWHLLGHTESVTTAEFPLCDESQLVEDSCTYPVSFNGKMRFTLDLPLTTTAADVEKLIAENADAQKWLAGKTPKKIIFVPKKIINVVF